MSRVYALIPLDNSVFVLSPVFAVSCSSLDISLCNLFCLLMYMRWTYCCNYPLLTAVIIDIATYHTQ